MTKKIFIIGLVLAAVLSMSGCMPGSEQWNIRIAAHCYIIGGGLQEGEKLIFVNGIQRKCLREWQGQMCKYVAVKYTFRKANGKDGVHPSGVAIAADEMPFHAAGLAHFLFAAEGALHLLCLLQIFQPCFTDKAFFHSFLLRSKSRCSGRSRAE